MPEQLVDCACQIHNFQQHCELLPTFDFCTKPHSAILRWFKRGINSHNNCTPENKRLGSRDWNPLLLIVLRQRYSDYREYLYSEYRAIEKKLLTRLINVDKAFAILRVLPRSNLGYVDQEFGGQCKEIYNDLLERAKKIYIFKRKEAAY